jgi:acetyl-CoA carboxylase biotin carboxyl carrier protein
MAFDEIERILALMREHDLAEFELEREDFKLRVKKSSAPPLMPAVMPVAASSVAAAASSPLPASGPVAATSPADAADDELELAVVKSPIVGTFYRSPEPGAPAFVEVGERVRKDQVLCIIEAMKLMNEITSEYDGEIVNAYVDNGKPVQYGERLFAIRTS